MPIGVSSGLITGGASAAGSLPARGVGRRRRGRGGGGATSVVGGAGATVVVGAGRRRRQRSSAVPRRRATVAGDDRRVRCGGCVGRRSGRRRGDVTPTPVTTARPVDETGDGQHELAAQHLASAASALRAACNRAARRCAPRPAPASLAERVGRVRRGRRRAARSARPASRGAAGRRSRRTCRASRRRRPTRRRLPRCRPRRGARSSWIGHACRELRGEIFAVALGQRGDDARRHRGVAALVAAELARRGADACRDFAAGRAACCLRAPRSRVPRRGGARSSRRRATTPGVGSVDRVHQCPFGRPAGCSRGNRARLSRAARRSPTPGAARASGSSSTSTSRSKRMRRPAAVS